MLSPTSLKFIPMTEFHARAIIHWRYQAPYDFYNHDPAQLDELLHSTFLNPSYHYFAVLDDRNYLVAFRCFGEDARVSGGDYSADALDMGGGLRPDLTGRGMGPQVIQSAINFANVAFSPPAFRTTIAGFNLRAQRACEKVGYVFAQRFVATHSGVPFVILLRSA